MEVSEELKPIRSILGQEDSAVVVERSPNVLLRYSKAETKKSIDLLILLVMRLLSVFLLSMSFVLIRLVS